MPTFTATPPATVVEATPRPQPETSEVIQAVNVSGSEVNLRSGPGLEHEVHGQVGAGDRLPVTGISTDGQWLQVLRDGQAHWIYADLTDLAADLRHILPEIQAPDLTTNGSYDNLADHLDGRYELRLDGEQVKATLTTTRSSVKFWAQEVAAPLFTVPLAFRPPYAIIRFVEGRPVRADGTLDSEQTAPYRFQLQVDPDGKVHYVNGTRVEGVEYLAYMLETIWGTTPAANDCAVLAIIRGSAPVVLTCPSGKLKNKQISFREDGRLDRLSNPLPTDTIPLELAELSELRCLNYVEQQQLFHWIDPTGAGQTFPSGRAGFKPPYGLPSQSRRSWVGSPI